MTASAEVSAPGHGQASTGSRNSHRGLLWRARRGGFVLPAIADGARFRVRVWKRVADLAARHLVLAYDQFVAAEARPE